jgi:glucose-1-phosphate thymidylyltransferase
MKAIVLCAGFGTRMYPLTKDRAKPLLPVAGKPIVGHLLDQLTATRAVDESIIVTNERFHSQFVAWSHGRFPVLNDGATDDDNRLGAVRDLAWALGERDVRAPVLVAAGDNLFRDTIAPFVADFLAAPRNLILRYRERDPDELKRTGVAEIDEDGRLVRFVEKPEAPPSEWACPALYGFDADALAELGAYVDEHPSADALGSFIAWLAPRVPVFTHEMRGSRLDAGDWEGYARAESWFRNGA